MSTHEGIEDVVAQMRQMIDTHGWGVTGVFDPDDDEVPFAYTVGLTAKGLPELSIYGLSPTVGAEILNRVAADAVAGNVLAESIGQQAAFSGQGVEVLAGYLGNDYVLTSIRMDDLSDLSMARRIYDGVTAVQLVWPDVEGRFPWDDNYGLAAKVQPLKGAAGRRKKPSTE